MVMREHAIYVNLCECIIPRTAAGRRPGAARRGLHCARAFFGEASGPRGFSRWSLTQYTLHLVIKACKDLANCVPSKPASSAYSVAEAPQGPEGHGNLPEGRFEGTATTQWLAVFLFISW